MKTSLSRQALIWDLPTRVFHWLFAICVIGAVVTVKVGGSWMDWHPRLGIAALVLVAFRIVWGLIGSKPSRFTTFVKTPKTVWQFIRNPASVPYLGHNPLGGWSVVAMLLSVGTQAVTGLFVTDDILFEGPLYSYVSGATANLMVVIHKTNDKVLMGLVVLHLLAILIYSVRGKKLIRAMISGHGKVENPPAGTASTPDGWRSRLSALAILIVLSAGGVWLASLNH